MHRRTELWGPDGTVSLSNFRMQCPLTSSPLALEFDPERWLDNRLKTYLTHNPFIFLPFNAGPRICLGQQASFQRKS